MGGAGCCDSKAFGAPCSDCAFDGVTQGHLQVNSAASDSPVYGPTFGLDEVEAEAYRVLQFSRIAAASQESNPIGRALLTAEIFGRSADATIGATRVAFVTNWAAALATVPRNFFTHSWSGDSNAVSTLGLGGVGGSAEDGPGGPGDSDTSAGGGGPSKRKKKAKGRCCVEKLVVPARFLTIRPKKTGSHAYYSWFFSVYGKWIDGRKQRAGSKLSDCNCECCLFVQEVDVTIKTDKHPGTYRTHGFVKDCRWKVDGTWKNAPELGMKAGDSPPANAEEWCPGQTENVPAEFENNTRYKESTCEITVLDNPGVYAPYGQTTHLSDKFRFTVHDTCIPTVRRRAYLNITFKVVLDKDGDPIEDPEQGVEAWSDLDPMRRKIEDDMLPVMPGFPPRPFRLDPRHKEGWEKDRGMAEVLHAWTRVAGEKAPAQRQR